MRFLGEMSASENVVSEPMGEESVAQGRAVSAQLVRF